MIHAFKGVIAFLIWTTHSLTSLPSLKSVLHAEVCCLQRQVSIVRLRNASDIFTSFKI